MVKEVGTALFRASCLSTKITKHSLGWIMRSFYNRSLNHMKQLWKTLVQCHIDYCSQLWQPLQSGQLQKIEGLQSCEFLKKLDFAGGRGGQSSANQRNRGPGKSTKAAYWQRVGNPLPGRDWWQYRQPQQSSASSSSWQGTQPPSGSASVVDNSRVYEGPPCTRPADDEIVLI